MEALIELAIQKSQNMGHTSIFCGLAKENSCSLWKKDSIVNITDYALDIYSTHKVNLRVSIPWMTIKNSTYIDNSIKLKFEDKNVTLDSMNDILLAYGSILHILYQILSKKELSKVLDKDQIFEKKHKSPLGPLNRIVQQHKIKGKTILPKNYETLRQILIFESPQIRLSDFESPEEFFPYLLDIIPLCSSVNSLYISNVSNLDIYEILSSNFLCISGLSFVEIDGRSNSFSKFLNSFSKTDTNICGLSFRNSRFSINDLKKLKLTLINKPVGSICFHSSFTEESMSYFHSTFFDSSFGIQFSSLVLDGTKNLDISLILKHCPNLFLLSLENCGLEIEDVFLEISNGLMRNIRALNVSGNKCSQFSQKPIQLPNSLISFVLNSIQWSDSCLQNCLKLIFNRNDYGTKISLSKTKASENEWQRVFFDLSKSGFSALISLIWDSNPVDARLFSLLNKNKNVEYLSICDCFSEKDSEEINWLSDFVSKAYCLKYLIVRGGSKRIGKNCASIIRSVLNSASIIHFDISHNNISNPGLLLMRQFLQKQNSLEVLGFDGSNPQTPDSLIELLELASHHKNHLKISFPFDDFAELEKKKMMKTEEFRNILIKYQRPHKMSTHFGKFIIPSHSIFFNPLLVFKIQNDISIPKYFTQNEVEELKSCPIKPFVPFSSIPKPTFNMVSRPQTQSAPTYIVESPKKYHPNNKKGNNTEIKLISESVTESGSESVFQPPMSPIRHKKEPSPHNSPEVFVDIKVPKNDSPKSLDDNVPISTTIMKTGFTSLIPFEEKYEYYSEDTSEDTFSSGHSDSFSPKKSNLSRNKPETDSSDYSDELIINTKTHDMKGKHFSKEEKLMLPLPPKIADSEDSLHKDMPSVKSIDERINIREKPLSKPPMSIRQRPQRGVNKESIITEDRSSQYGSRIRPLRGAAALKKNDSGSPTKSIDEPDTFGFRIRNRKSIIENEIIKETLNPIRVSPLKNTQNSTTEKPFFAKAPPLPLVTNDSADDNDMFKPMRPPPLNSPTMTTNESIAKRTRIKKK